MKYIKTMENREDLVKKLEKLNGKKAVYTRMPESTEADATSEAAETAE